MSETCTWCYRVTVPGSPADVLELLTDPEAIARWAPVSFEAIAFEGEGLRSGDRARVAGRLSGHQVQFDVDVLRASEEGLELVAEGPVLLRVSYGVRPAPSGSEIDASISVEGHGLVGRVLAKATETMLATGALRVSLERLARELETETANRPVERAGDSAIWTDRHRSSHATSPSRDKCALRAD